MLADFAGRPIHLAPPALDLGLLALALADRRGVPRAGRLVEMAALRRVGAQDPSLGRIYEGHVNAVQLVARSGSDAQHARLEREVSAGHLFGVWNTQDDDPVHIVRSGERFTLSGAKTWASGATTVARPIVTAAWPDGTVQMCLVPMERHHPAVDGSAWRPLGMQASQSFRVDFSGVELDAEDLIGRPGDYERQPWFYGGALRFAAVQPGIIERLSTEAANYLLERARDGDPFQRARIGEMRIGVHTALHWIEAGIAAWQAFDASESEEAGLRAIEVADMARTAIERIALEAVELTMRSVGAHGLVEPLPFAGLVRDLQMYLRQPAPDAALARVGAAAFCSAIARSTEIARSTDVGA